MPAHDTYDYAVIRVVPRVEREEFVNAGVVVSCPSRGFLEARIELNPARVLALDPAADIETIRMHLDSIPVICRGGAAAGAIGDLSPRERFRWLTSPRSTVIQFSAAHTGRCEESRSAARAFARDDGAVAADRLTRSPMRMVRDLAVFLVMFIAVALVYPAAFTVVSAGTMNGREFATYFGWFSWPHAISALVLGLVFLVGGASMGRLITASPLLWAFSLGALYDVMRAYSSRDQLAAAHGSVETFWACVELAVPVIAAMIGAYLSSHMRGGDRRSAPQPRNPSR